MAADGEGIQVSRFDAIYALAREGLGHEDISVALQFSADTADGRTWRAIAKMVVLKKLLPGKAWAKQVA